MSWIDGLRERLKVLRPGSADRELEAEFAFHLEREVERRIAEGATPGEAARAARLAFGGTDRYREEVRDARGPRLDEWLRDLRHAARSLGRNRGFALASVLTLGLGIGGATAMFTITDAVLLRPLPYPDSERLVMVWRVVERFGFDRAPSSVPDYVDWRRGLRTFDDLAAYTGARTTLVGEGEAERVSGARVSGNLFGVLGAGAAHGRAVQPSDDAPGADPTVVLSHDLWTRRYGADPTTVGRTIVMDGVARRVIGVAPRGFAFPSSTTEYWIPLGIDPAVAERDANFLQVIGRLAPGMSAQAAEADLSATAARVAAANPGGNETDRVWLESRRDYEVGDVAPVLLVLTGAVALLLMLACANLVNLLLVRSTSRRRELAVRAALGARGARLRRPVLAESLVLALVGGGLGVVVAWSATELLLALEPGALPRRVEIGVDLRVLGFALATSLACALVCGLIPAWRAGRRAPAEALHGGRLSDRGTARAQWGLVATQVALAVMLLIGAGLLGRSFVRLVSMPVGFDADRVLTASLSLPSSRYEDYAAVDRFYDALLERVGSLAGVEAVGATWALPFSDAFASGTMAPERARDRAANIGMAPVRGDYFRATGMRLLRGRGLSSSDAAGALPVAVVNATLAERFWPGGEAIGQRIVDPDDPSDALTVVGVVADVKRRALDETVEPEAYLPHDQATWGGGDLFVTVRASGDPYPLGAALRREVRALDPSLPVMQLGTLADRVGESVAPQRFRTSVFIALASVASLLALIGIYGVLSFVVSGRRRELAIRLALGARGRTVAAEMLRQCMRVTAIGVVIGLVGAIAGTRTLERFLFQTDALDVSTYVSVVAALVVASLVAAWVPARRAAATDPMRTLREE